MPEERLRYHEPRPLERANAEQMLSSPVPGEVCEALVSVAFHDPDWRRVQGHCLRLAGHAEPECRAIAATCLGHLARIRGQLDLELVMPVLERLRNDSKVLGQAEDALDDIRHFLAAE